MSESWGIGEGERKLGELGDRLGVGGRMVMMVRDFSSGSHSLSIPRHPISAASVTCVSVEGVPYSRSEERCLTKIITVGRP